MAETIDVAVHSMKDLPVAQRPGLTIAAVPPRADARDAFISERSASWETLPAGSRVGTSSARRAVQLLHRRPDIVTVAIRGNVETRLRKMQAGDYDAILLAVAGLERLGRCDVITQFLPFSLMLPAPGQGALGVQIRTADRRLWPMVRMINDPVSRCAVEAERAFLAALGGGCNTPAAAYGRLRQGKLLLDGMIVREDGRRVRRARVWASVRDPQSAGGDLLRAMNQRGAS